MVACIWLKEPWASRAMLVARYDGDHPRLAVTIALPRGQELGKCRLSAVVLLMHKSAPRSGCRCRVGCSLARGQRLLAPRGR